MDAQRTLRRQISCVGIGLHSGNRVNLTLRPAPADFGIRFRRTDLGHHEVPATVQNLAGIQLATGLASNEVSVETVEHLLAALVSVGIDNVIIELNSPEVPIMDGSAAPFIYLIHEAGVKRLSTPRKYLKIVRPIALSRGDKRIALYPSDHFKVTYSISYDHPLLRHGGGENLDAVEASRCVILMLCHRLFTSLPDDAAGLRETTETSPQGELRQLGDSSDRRYDAPNPLLRQGR